MAIGNARGIASYEREGLIHELGADLLARYFRDAKAVRQHNMKFIDAWRDDESSVRFWFKQAWSNSDDANFAAIQFGLFKGRQADDIPDAEFKLSVQSAASRAKMAGASYLLVVHCTVDALRACYALKIEDVLKVYSEQLKRWPRKARNTKSPTLWLSDQREVADQGMVKAAQQYCVPLDLISELKTYTKSATYKKNSGTAERKILTEISIRLKQYQFRNLIGEAYHWTCVVSGCTTWEALEAAHLPGRKWREHNDVTDGIMLRADLHKLLDRGVATIKGNQFCLDQTKQLGDYKKFHGMKIKFIDAFVAS